MFVRSFILFALSLMTLLCSSGECAEERTLSIIKPDAVQADHIGDIIAIFEKEGLHVIGAKMQCITEEQAREFYVVHTGKPFFEDLVKYISSGPSVVLVLEGKNAIAKNRELMGATDPKKAAEGTIRQRFAQSISANAVHGSDSPSTAKNEILFFFKEKDLCPRR